MKELYFNFAQIFKRNNRIYKIFTFLHIFIIYFYILIFEMSHTSLSMNVH